MSKNDKQHVFRFFSNENLEEITRVSKEATEQAMQFYAERNKAGAQEYVDLLRAEEQMIESIIESSQHKATVSKSLSDYKLTLFFCNTPSLNKNLDHDKLYEPVTRWISYIKNAKIVKGTRDEVLIHRPPTSPNKLYTPDNYSRHPNVSSILKALADIKQNKQRS